MTDDGDEKITMDLPTESTVDEDDLTIGENRAEIGLRKMERDRDIRMYKKLISSKSRFADSVIVQILRVLVSSDEIGDERVLLGSLALATVLNANYSFEDFTSELRKFWSLEESFLSAFDENFQIHDLEWFKLAITHGCLQVNVKEIYPWEIYYLAFEVLHRNCLTYTKYSYVAYKILQTWLEKTSRVNFWNENNTSEIESRLEAVIFSNWDNCISEIVRRNTTQIFPTYLRIMSDKYNGFLGLIFENCMQNLSWQNETKYTILVEVCKISEDLSSIVNSGLTSCIFTSLTRNHLKHAGTLLYLTVLRKLKVNEWESIFAEDFFRISAKWESENEVTAIELLWEQWMKPTIRKFPNIFDYLWRHPSMRKLKLGQTYLEKTGDEQSLNLTYDDTKLSDVLNSRVTDISETVRLNAFAVVCRGNNWKINANEAEPFSVVKRFLYFNANASTASMRKGIIENFKIFLANTMKLADVDSQVDRHVRRLVGWLHEFLLDCFEIGSSYQRKILGLSLYGIILNFTSDNFVDGISAKATRYGATLRCANALRTRMIEDDSWKFVDRKSAVLLLKLVIDQMVDVREKSTSIITRYVHPDVFTKSDKEFLLETAIKNCNSSRFHEIAGGSALVRILLAWRFTDDNYADFFLNEATTQLYEMRRDILKSAARGSSFFGALTAILEIFLTNELANNEAIGDHSIGKILDLIEEATRFFLSALSTNDVDCEYSSSFKDMSIAIEESIRNSEINEDNEECVLSPAHQLVISCIWMSLKVSCELAAEIGCRGKTERDVDRAANLVVSVLLKCRHKGAIEAAGLALAKLTKILSKGKYNEVMKNHLANLLSIDTENEINLTRRGAGLTIMFHRIVSSDDRNNRPFVHFAVRKLLDSLSSKTRTRNEDCQIDSPCSRHLHFLRSLVADKSLQAQLVRYMEDVCLTCFEYLQSPDWTVRNASLQLFGAIVPRLVGQCSARELDYGIGNSIDHFVTHYPVLASKVLEQLEGSVSCSFDRKGNIRFDDLPIVNNVVPILTLISKMSTGGCDLVDYSSRDYSTRVKATVSVLLGHPVFHVRGLAAKAYAAFVPFADIHRELAKMKLRKINWYRDNYNHGQLLAQFYLQRKYEHEIKSTGDKFIIRKHEIYEDYVKIATRVQLERARYTWNVNFYPRDESSPVGNSASYTIHNLHRLTISAMLFNCLINCPVASSILRTDQTIDSRNVTDRDFITLVLTRQADRPDLSGTPGLFEFVKYLIAFNGQSLSCRFARLFCTNHGTTNAHQCATSLQNNQSPNEQLKNLVCDAYRNFEDPMKTHVLLPEVTAIRDILENRELGSDELTRDILDLSELLKNIDKHSARPCAAKLRNIGHQISIDATKTINESLFDSTIRYVSEQIYDEKNDVVKKHMAIDCLSRLVEKTFAENESKFVLDPSLRYTRTLICVVATLLTDQETETRELTSEKLTPLRRIIDEPGKPVCSRANLHKILNKLSSTWAKNSSVSIIDCLAIFHFLTDTISVKMSKDGLKSPYEEDETFQRDDTELLNILFYCVKTLNERISLTGNDDNVDLQQIDGTILAKYELQGDARIDLTNIETCLKLSTANYLSCKKRALMRVMRTKTILETIISRT